MNKLILNEANPTIEVDNKGINIDLEKNPNRVLGGQISAITRNNNKKKPLMKNELDGSKLKNSIKNKLNNLEYQRAYDEATDYSDKLIICDTFINVEMSQVASILGNDIQVKNLFIKQLDELGFDKISNPFIDYLNKILTYIKLDFNHYAIVNNLAVDRIISNRDLSLNDYKNKLLYNSSLYNQPFNEFNLIIKQYRLLKDKNISEQDVNKFIYINGKPGINSRVRKYSDLKNRLSLSGLYSREQSDVKSTKGLADEIPFDNIKLYIRALLTDLRKLSDKDKQTLGVVSNIPNYSAENEQIIRNKLKFYDLDTDNKKRDLINQLLNRISTPINKGGNN